MKNKVSEIFSYSTNNPAIEWKEVVEQQHCQYLQNRCNKVRKSIPSISIGTCMVKHGKDEKELIICPHRFLENRKVFLDCIHLLTLHEPGNDLHIVPEVAVPGGSIDYLLVSVRGNKVKDFVGVELQALDTTGTIWPERQRLLHEWGIAVESRDRASSKPYGVNWKMTAKTTLVQLLHKIETFEYVGKKLVLVLQDDLLEYMKKEFSFSHVSHSTRIGDAMHFHAYTVVEGKDRRYQITLAQRLSTDSAGVATCMGLRGQTAVELEVIVRNVESKISEKTLLTL